MTKTTTTHSPISRLSPAKINLFLHITDKRTDDYHNLQTVFRLLDWGDYLHFSVANHSMAIDSTVDSHYLCKQLLTITGADAISDSIEDNLIFKAAQALLAAAMASNQLLQHLPSVQVTLDKHLPMGAGVGGGSSNAATALLTLNEIWQLHFTQQALIDIATKVGADVPIFIFGQDAIAMGIGEQLTAIDLPDQQYLILTPDAHINTAQLFVHPKLQRNVALLSIDTIKNQSIDYMQRLNTPYQNVFTPVVTDLAPAVANALHYLQRLEAQAQGTARMTGSGSAVFLPLEASVATDQTLLAKWIHEAPCAGYVVGSL